MSGPLHRRALETAVRTVVERHEALRTVFIQTGDIAEQVVLEQWDAGLTFVDLGTLPVAERDEQLHTLLQVHSLKPFDLARDPMLRTALFRLDDEEHVVLFQAHHIAVDGWSVEILFREVQEIYDATVAGRRPQLPELTLQYRDFASWQRERVQGQDLEQEAEYWRTALSGAPTLLALPSDRPRPPAQRFAGATQEVVLDREVAQAVTELARGDGATPYMVLLSVFGTLLYRVTGQDDILLGGPFANRGRPEFQQLIGYFANTLPLRLKLAGNPSFRTLLGRAREATLELLDHEELSFEGIVEAVRPPRHAAANPLFQVNFRVRVDAASSLELTGTTTRRVPLDIGLARFDLALELQVHDGGVLAQFNYDTDLFDAATIDRLANDFIAVLRQAVTAPETRLLDFRLAGEWTSAGRIAEGAGIRSFRSKRVLSGLVGLAHALPALGEFADNVWPVLASLA